MWRVTRLVLSDSHLAAEHKDCSRLWERCIVARVVPCSGLHARCALGRDTITQHAVIYHVYAQQLRELIVRVCRCVGVCVCVQQQKPLQFYHVSCIMSHALAAIAAHASPEHTHPHTHTRQRHLT